MSKIALVVEFQVKPEKRQAFEALMRQHSAGTLQDEEGCLQFDVLVPKKDDGRVLLYEVYRDDAALQEHMNSARLAKTRGGYDDMIDGRSITMCTVG